MAAGQLIQAAIEQIEKEYQVTILLYRDASQNYAL